jgi:hypothetical protein
MATAAVLLWRREPPERYVILAAGFLISALASVPYLVTHPVIRDTLWRYERQQAPDASASAIARGLFNPDRFVTAASTYLTFWNPRFLFVDGPRSRWPIGAFVLAVAGLSVAAVLRAVRRPDVTILLLLAAVVTSPILATSVGEPGEIRRAGVMIPAVVLLAIAGLDYLDRPDSDRSARIAGVAVWGTIILVAAAFHDQLMHGQALVRAATVSLVVSGLAVLLDGDPRGSGFPRGLLPAIAIVCALNAVYIAANYAIPVGIALLVAIGAAAMMNPQRSLPSYATTVIVAAITADFLFVYVDYAQIHRVGAVPATAIIFGLRAIFGSIAVVAAMTVAAAKMRHVEGGLTRRRLVLVAAAGIVAAQLLYFGIDVFTDHRLRVVQCAFVLTVVVGVAALVRRYGPARVRVADIATAGLVGLTALQFAGFYADYFTGFRVRGSGERDGNERIAFEAAIAETRDRSVPAIYLGWPDALANLYWRFYAIKHHREDLLPRTIPALDFDRNRIRTLPPGSIVITRPSQVVDATIDAMAAAGEVGDRELLLAPDGTRAFWILHVADAHAS